jgi:hypothetical protein
MPTSNEYKPGRRHRTRRCTFDIEGNPTMLYVFADPAGHPICILVGVG